MKIITKKLILVVTVVFAVTASFICYSKNVTNKFTDVHENEWFAESVEYVKDKGLMNGITVTTFEPQTSITRGMIVTIIYRLEGSPEAKSELQFSDVNPTYYYCTPIIWASENGIVNGYSKDTFAPDDEITREQFATILYRYAEKKGIDVSDSSNAVVLLSFEDESKISEYAVKALSWANDTGLIKGVTVTTLEPQGKATRAQAATIFMRFDKLIKQSEQSYSSTKTKDNETDNEETALSKNDNSSPNNDSGSKKDPVENDDKDDVYTSGDNNDNDKNAGEWDDVNDKTDKDENEVSFTKSTIVISSTSAKAGEKASVTISFNNNPGTAVVMLDLKFDDEMLNLTDVKYGSQFEENGEQPRFDGSPDRIVWSNVKDVGGTCDFVTLNFDVNSTAESGNVYDVEVSYIEGEICNTNEQFVDFDITNGNISIK